MFLNTDLKLVLKSFKLRCVNILEYLKKLALFREADLPDISVLNYFDEKEVPVKNYCVEDGDVNTFLLEVIGTPRNYGPSREEKEKKVREENEKKVSLIIIMY